MPHEIFKLTVEKGERMGYLADEYYFATEELMFAFKGINKEALSTALVHCETVTLVGSFADTPIIK